MDDGGTVSVLTGDPFSPATLRDPVPFEAEVREAGPLVRLERYQIWATGRYTEVEVVLRNWADFSSSFGTGLTNIKRDQNWRRKSVILDTDPPEHARSRAVMMKVLSPGAIRKLRQDFMTAAEQMVDALVMQREFDAAKDLAEAFPLKVFPDAVGLAPEGREHLLPYANLNFQAMGPRNKLYEDALASVGDSQEYVAWQMRREALAPDGFGARIYEVAEAEGFPQEDAALLVRSFLSAGVDTTIFGIGSAIYELARHPAQWALVREKPALVRQAFEETLRYRPPSPLLARTTPRPTELAGVRLGTEEKILLFVGAANRDPRRWEDPDEFDLRRRTAGHLAFGTGIHQCVGQIIARLEAESVLSALVRRVGHIHLNGRPELKLSNWLRGFTSLPVSIDPG